MRIISLDQRSPDWLRWRDCGIGSSDAAAIVDSSPWRTRAQLWAEKVAKYHVKPRRPGRGVLPSPAGRGDNSAMARGRRLEPLILAKYESLLGCSTSPVCCEHDAYPFLRASLDGWDAKRRIGVEAKAPNRDDHQGALEGRVPDKYLPQIHHQQLVTGSMLFHYVSYSDYFPTGQQLAVVSVVRDEESLAALLAAELDFWSCVVEKRDLCGMTAVATP